VSEFAREELRRYAPGRPTALTIGVFDGVHRGHRYLIDSLITRARALDLAAGAVTLYPNPEQVLRPQARVPYLTSLEERLDLLRASGLDFVVLLTFTSDLAELSADAFVSMLHEELSMRLLFMGPDHAFGRDREGTPDRMTELGRRLGFAVELLRTPLNADDHTVSATAIRTALTAGDLDTVASLLGRPYSIRGPVVRGQELGRQIGFPTANVGITADRALPAFGVYAAWAYLGESRYMAAANVGVRPTVAGTVPTVEAHILDFEGDIYGKSLKLELVKRLRPERRFPGLDALKAQIAADVAAVREVLS
jgi:riboflavin kinase/FMN adenylyltransferase